MGAAVFGAAALAGSAATTPTAPWPHGARRCASCQRISIHETIFHVGTSQWGTFVLKPLTKGPVKSDSGIFHYVWVSGAGTTQHGHDVAIDRGVDILHGKHGILAIARTLTLLDPAVRPTHGTSTWTVVGGNGAYLDLSGQGIGVTVVTRSETERTTYTGAVRRPLP
jgi:hypothetical protein